MHSTSRCPDNAYLRVAKSTIVEQRFGIQRRIDVTALSRLKKAVGDQHLVHNEGAIIVIVKLARRDAAGCSMI